MPFALACFFYIRAKLKYEASLYLFITGCTSCVDLSVLFIS